MFTKQSKIASVAVASGNKVWITIKQYVYTKASVTSFWISVQEKGHVQASYLFVVFVLFIYIRHCVYFSLNELLTVNYSSTYVYLT